MCGGVGDYRACDMCMFGEVCECLVRLYMCECCESGEGVCMVV